MTVKTVATFNAPKLDVKKHRAKIDKSMTEQQLEAIKRWLKNVLIHTPTYTGTARGTYAGVGRIVGKSVRRGKIRGNSGRAKRKKYFIWRGKKYPLGFTAGKMYSDERIWKKGSRTRMLYAFSFNQRLPYVLWNEILPAPAWLTLPSNPPWGALASALNAYRRYANGPMRRGFPKVIGSIGKVKIRSK